MQEELFPCPDVKKRSGKSLSIDLTASQFFGRFVYGPILPILIYGVCKTIKILFIFMLHLLMLRAKFGTEGDIQPDRKLAGVSQSCVG